MSLTLVAFAQPPEGGYVAVDATPLLHFASEIIRDEGHPLFTPALVFIEQHKRDGDSVCTPLRITSECLRLMQGMGNDVWRVLCSEGQRTLRTPRLVSLLFSHYLTVAQHLGKTLVT